MDTGDRLVGHKEQLLCRDANAKIDVWSTIDKIGSTYRGNLQVTPIQEKLKESHSS